MQKLICGLLLLVGIATCCYSAVAQSVLDVPQDPRNQKTPEELHNELVRVKLGVERQPSPPVRREPRVIKEGLLAPTVQDRFEHERLLALPTTGLLRLLPREVYDWRTYKTPAQIDLRGGGAYFSFFYRSHEYGYGSDLELDHKQFTVGFAGADYGMLTSIGDVAVDEVGKNNPTYSFMASYKPPSEEKEARLEFQRFQSGVTVDGTTYKRTVPVEADTTYLLRSIVYRTSDVLVAFRVSRIDPDGSVIIAWRLLRSFNAPNLY